MPYMEDSFDDQGNKNLKKKRKNLQTHNIQFSPNDEKKVKALAEKAGLPVNTYIKHRALNARIKAAPPPIDLSPLTDHTKKIDELIKAIQAFTPHPHRLLYESDLEQIERMLHTLVQSDAEVVAMIRSQIGGVSNDGDDRVHSVP